MINSSNQKTISIADAVLHGTDPQTYKDFLKPANLIQILGDSPQGKDKLPLPVPTTDNSSMHLHALIMKMMKIPTQEKNIRIYCIN